jgi:hypothetical protein
LREDRSREELEEKLLSIAVGFSRRTLMNIKKALAEFTLKFRLKPFSLQFAVRSPKRTAIKTIRVIEKLIAFLIKTSVK